MLMIFDMDGLLLNTEKISIGAWIKAFEETGYRLDKDLAISRIGTSRKTRNDFYLENWGKELPIKKSIILGINTLPKLYMILNPY